MSKKTIPNLPEDFRLNGEGIRNHLPLTKLKITNSLEYKIIASSLSFNESVQILLNEDQSLDKWIVAMKAFSYHVLQSQSKEKISGCLDIIRTFNIKTMDDYKKLARSGKLFNSNSVATKIHSKKTIIYAIHFYPIMKHAIDHGFYTYMAIDIIKSQSEYTYFKFGLTPLTVEFYCFLLKQIIGTTETSVYENYLEHLTWDFKWLSELSNKRFELKIKNYCRLLSQFSMKLWQDAYENLKIVGSECFVDKEHGVSKDLKIINSALTVSKLISII